MRNILFSLLFLPALMEAETIDVNKIRLAGPYPIAKPFMTDSLDTEGKKIDLDEVYLESLTPDPSPRRGGIILGALYLRHSIFYFIFSPVRGRG